MRVLKSIGDICLFFLCIIFIIVDILFIYYRFIDSDKTIGINIVGNQVGTDYIHYEDGMTEQEKKEFEDRLLFEINLYDNTEKNGIFLAEFQFNYFTTYKLQVSDYRSSGYQLVFNDKEASEVFGSAGINAGYNENVEDMYLQGFYETTDFVNWKGNQQITTGIKRDTEYIIKIDGKPFSLNFNGTYKTTEKVLGFLWDKEVTKEYTFTDLFLYLIDSASKSSEGESSFYITPDFSNWFIIKKFNEDGVLEENVYSDIVKNYAHVKINYTKDGMVSSKQSLFGMINSNPSFDLFENDFNSEYWVSNIIYNLDESYLSYRYSELYQGYFVSISQEFSNKFSKMPSSKINLVIDLDSDYLKNNNYNIVGVDYNGLENLKIYTLTIKSSNTKVINMLSSCLNEDLHFFKHTSNIQFNWVESKLPSSCEEVIL